MSILTKRLPIGKDLGYSVLTASIDAAETTIAVAASSPFPVLSSATNRRRFIPAVICPAADPGTLTFSDLQNGEHIVITDHEDASTSLTIIRGSSPATHPSGSLVMILPTAQAWESMFNYLSGLEAIVAALIGAPVAGDGVILNYGLVDMSSFKATQSGTPNMTVQIAAGIGAWRDQVFRGEATSKTFVAPVTSTRVDLITWDVINDAIAVVAGTEGAGAPAVPASHVGLYEVAIDVSQTSILNADLTDIRELA